MDIVMEIQTQYAHLSTASQKVVQYLLESPEEFLTSSALEIGEKSGTSSAAVIRLAKKLGCGSLEDLKINVAKNLARILKETELFDPVVEKTDTLEELAKKINAMAVHSLQLSLHDLDMNEFETAVEVLKQASNLYLHGIGASGLVAEDLYHKLRRAHIPSFFVHDAHMAIEECTYATNKDAAILISYSGRTTEILIAARTLKKNGAKIVAITRNSHSPLRTLSDIVLTVPDNEQEMRVGAVSSKYSTMWMADLLFFGLIHQNIDEMTEGFLKTAKVVQQLKEMR